MADSDTLETITFQWAIPEAPSGVSLWLLDTDRDTQINILDPGSPEHAIPMGFEGITSFVICGYLTGQVQREECLQ